ncbi:TnsD family Tn7-like transposition protein [Paraburkholderia fungorum]|uniref:TnsD family Tn7-like transposition protein n=1 Tax=Paraburkholderia fungorum TaxID=134537 RepID=UPI001C1E9E36|nr:TnsD family Tn7-like transposition protein [Paraburkholderia fungorum]MBU7443325.1 TnsD family transposase [Paraburkholderia fungorum]
MAIALRRPREDELLVSVFAEYVSDERVAHQHAFLRRVLGYCATSLFDMAGGLDMLAAETADYWQLTSDEIARCHTTYPYHTASCSAKVAEEVRAAMKSLVAGVRNRRGLGFGRFNRLDAFRYCPKCASEDVATGYRPFFRRSQQLPGVAYCASHQVPLLISRVASNSPFDGAKHFNDYFEGGRAIDIEVPDVEKMRRLVRVSEFSEEVLRGCIGGTGFFQKQNIYRKRLRAMGYSWRGASVHIDRLSQDLVEFYGASYLRWIGLFREGQKTRDWVVPLVCAGQAVPPTVAHVLLEVFLQSAERTQQSALNSVVVRCPARFGKHADSSFEGRVQFDADLRTGRAVCVCGTKFTFDVRDRHTAVRCISSYGESYRSEARELLELGESYRTVAEQLGVSIMTARRLTSHTQAGENCASYDDIRAWRAEWMNALASTPGSVSAVCRKQHRPLYRRLLQYDRRWLQQCMTRGMTGSERVNWPARDAAYVISMRKAWETLRATEPPRWVSKISILMLSGVPQGTRNQLFKLPTCSGFLKAHTESRGDYLRRLGQWRAGHYHGDRANTRA